MFRKSLYVISGFLWLGLMIMGIGVWIKVLNGGYYSNGGNVWRIYIQNNHIMIGDFWASLYLLWFPIKGINYCLDTAHKRFEEVLKILEKE